MSIAALETKVTPFLIGRMCWGGSDWLSFSSGPATQVRVHGS